MISWPSVPVELVRAAGFSPVFARGRGTPTPAADRVLEPDLFPNRLRQLVEAALTGRLADVAAIVLPRTSDPDYKCFLYLRELVRRGIAANAAARLAVRSAAFGRRRRARVQRERARDVVALLASLAGRQHRADDLRQRDRERQSGARRGQAPQCPANRCAAHRGRRRIAAARRFLAARARALRRACEATADSLAGRPTLDGPRVLLAGAPVDSTALHAAIEADGAVVVAELSPFGSGGVSADVELADDPFAALADITDASRSTRACRSGRLMRKLDDAARRRHRRRPLAAAR